MHARALEQLGRRGAIVRNRRAVRQYKLEHRYLRGEVLDFAARAVGAGRDGAGNRELRAGRQIFQRAAFAQEVDDLRVRAAAFYRDGSGAVLGRRDLRAAAYSPSLPQRRDDPHSRGGGAATHSFKATANDPRCRRDPFFEAATRRTTKSRTRLSLASETSVPPEHSATGEKL